MIGTLVLLDRGYTDSTAEKMCQAMTALALTTMDSETPRLDKVVFAYCQKRQ